METLQAIRKIPGGLMVVPLLLGTTVNTFFRNILQNAFDDTFTIYLRKLGAMLILAVFIFCNATTADFEKTGVTVYKDMLITAVKVGVGIIIGLICGTLLGEKGFLDLPTLAIVDALANSNGGPYATLVGEYGDTTDAGAVFTLSINNGPFSTMVALGVAGVTKMSMPILVGYIIPVIVGCILGSLDEDICKLCESGAIVLIPFFAFPLGVGLNIISLLKVGSPKILLDVACTLATGLVDYLAYKLLRMDYPEVGGAIETTAGNAAVTPASIVATDATLLAAVEVAVAQITATIIVIVTLCPVLVSYLHRVEMRKHGR